MDSIPMIIAKIDYDFFGKAHGAGTVPKFQGFIGTPRGTC